MLGTEIPNPSPLPPCVSHLLPSRLICRWPEACKLPASDSFAHQLLPRDARRYWQHIGRKGWLRRDSPVASGSSLSQRMMAFAAPTALSQFHPWLGSAASVDPFEAEHSSVSPSTAAGTGSPSPAHTPLTPFSLSPSLPSPLFQTCYHIVPESLN